MTNKEAIKYLIAPITTSTEPSAEYLKQKEAYDLAIKALEERPKGEWVVVIDYSDEYEKRWHYECSECRNTPYYGGDIDTLHFCPNCGAEMQTKEDNPCPCIECTSTDKKRDCQYCMAWAKWSLE